jgi:AcrR family transcriptional regulator
VAAARDLLASGSELTVERAADRSGISRTTAYRYFPNHRALLIASYPELDTSSLLADDAPADPVARLERVLERITSQVVEHEPELRAMLRLSLQPGTRREELPLRQGRAIGWIEDALEPLRGRVPDPEIRRLALAIRATVGIEALVWLTDIGGLTRQGAAELMRSSARTLLRAALDERPGG